MFRDFPLSSLTTVKTGGKAKGLLKVKTLQELVKTINSLMDEKFLIVGGCSNLIFSDSGYEGIIVKNELIGIKTEDASVAVQSGTPLQQLVNLTIERGLSGLHKLTGIPGTVGGAIYGNAGAYGQTISDNLMSVTILKNSKLVTLKRAECNFAYRYSLFKQIKYPIVEIKFKFSKKDPQLLKEEADEVFKKRLEKYPPFLKCPGSFFMNVPLNQIPRQKVFLIPQDKIKNNMVHVGWLLESVGSKGYKVGGIEVADYHGNLFINRNNGTSTDYIHLALELANRIKAKYGIFLKPEVQIICK